MEKETISHVKGGSFLVQDTEPEEIFIPEDFSSQQKMISSMADEFVEKEIMPLLNEIDDQKEGLAVSLLRKAGELGLLSIDVPELYGGMGLDKISSALVTEQIGRTGSWAVSFGAHTGIGTLPIVFFGTEEQKKKYLPRLATGEWISSYSLSEPGSGSDALSAKTTAVLSSDGKYYLLNGTKMWLSNAGFADIYITFAKIDGDKFSCFIIEKDFEGVSTAPEEKKMGIKGSSTRQLILENAKVPVENLLGETGRGHIIAFNILNIGRLKLGAAVIGAAKRVLAQAVNYANNRVQFNKRISEFGLIKQKIAEMAVRIYAGESIVYRTSGLIDNMLQNIHDDSADAMRQTLKSIEEYAVECAIIKVYCSEILDFVVDESLQIYGGYGFSEEFPVARAYRDSRINRIFEGTNEINRLLIPGMILKRSMKGEIPVLARAAELAESMLTIDRGEEDPDDIFYAQKTIVRNIKKVAVMTLGAAAQKYMDKITEEQEILAAVSDIIMETYVMESVLLRTIKLKRHNYPADDLSMAITRSFINDAIPRIELSARNALSAMEEGDMLKTYLNVLRRYTRYSPVNTISLHREIADFLISREKYDIHNG
ncbi:MAG: acyl-CoA dehydrogenase family protein [Syntrophothermus sp.]